MCRWSRRRASRRRRGRCARRPKWSASRRRPSNCAICRRSTQSAPKRTAPSSSRFPSTYSNTSSNPKPITALLIITVPTNALLSTVSTPSLTVLRFAAAHNNIGYIYIRFKISRASPLLFLQIRCEIFCSKLAQVTVHRKTFLPWIQLNKKTFKLLLGFKVKISRKFFSLNRLLRFNKTKTPWPYLF